MVQGNLPFSPVPEYSDSVVHVLRLPKIFFEPVLGAGPLLAALVGQTEPGSISRCKTHGRHGLHAIVGDQHIAINDDQARALRTGNERLLATKTIQTLMA